MKTWFWPTCAMGILLFVFGAGCSDDDNDRILVSAEVLEADAPASVSVGDIETGENGLLHHAVLVQWNGDEPRRLDDARFTHHVPGSNGDLIIAGRHCGADWDSEQSQVVHPCLLDLLLIVLEPGETHAYPIDVYTEVGPLTLGPGTYQVDEVIHFWPVDDAGMEPFQRSLGQFTVRLTYRVP